jgi:hypothetical protein
MKAIQLWIEENAICNFGAPTLVHGFYSPLFWANLRLRTLSPPLQWAGISLLEP